MRIMAALAAAAAACLLKAAAQHYVSGLLHAQSHCMPKVL
jgi:hypothetical protein